MKNQMCPLSCTAGTMFFPSCGVFAQGKVSPAQGGRVVFPLDQTLHPPVEAPYSPVFKSHPSRRRSPTFCLDFLVSDPIKIQQYHTHVQLDFQVDNQPRAAYIGRTAPIHQCPSQQCVRDTANPDNLENFSFQGGG